MSPQRFQVSDHPVRMMRVRLLRKLAERLDGIDVSAFEEGDVLDLPRGEAELLIAERWALAYRGPRAEVRATSTAHERSAAAEQSQRRTLEQLRRVREDMEARRSEQQERRRAEDRIREELHDSRSKVLNDHQ